MWGIRSLTIASSQLFFCPPSLLAQLIHQELPPSGMTMIHGYFGADDRMTLPDHVTYEPLYPWSKYKTGYRCPG